MNPDKKRPVSGRFRVTLDVDWPDAVVEAVRASTGATITMVNGPVLEGALNWKSVPKTARSVQYETGLRQGWMFL